MFSFKKTLFLIFTLIILSSFLSATILNVPGSFPTIQVGIDATVDTDTVLVQPGIYFENIDFNGKNITVASLFHTTQDTTYISQTIIDGNSNFSVVWFHSGEDSTAVLSGFTITNGYNLSGGGGIYCYDNSSPSLENLLVTNCYSYEGGGIYCNNSNAYIKNITISGNVADAGGGLICHSSNLILENVSITDNSTYPGSVYGWGGGICCLNSSIIMINTTIAENISDFVGGIYLYQSSSDLTNSILWNNSQEEIYLNSSSVTVTYSDIQDGWTGTGNIDVNPLFVNPAIGDYSLQPISPCIDAGDPSSPLDPDGTTADMGAWFYNQGSAIEDNEIENVKFNLSNYPNPFNPLTTIKFDIKENEIGVLKIFNIKGQLLESHQFEAGEHDFQWDASSMSSGVYLYQLQTENSTVSKKMLLLK